MRSIEGIAVVTDSTTTVKGTREVDGNETPIQYHIYNRRKMGRIGDFAIVHTGMSFINDMTINQIINKLNPEDFDKLTVSLLCEELRLAFEEELYADDSIKELEPGFMIVNIGITGYKDNKPFVHRLIYLRSENEGELLEVMESENTFSPESPYGIDYFGDYEFIQLVIRAAKERNLLKPFDILTLSETLELARTLMRFLIEFQQFMVSFSVAFPIESAVITNEEGFQWIDQIELDKFHYDHDRLP